MSVTAAVILACVAGYVDVLSYLTDGTFVANMTGNTVLLAISLVRANWHSAEDYSASIAAFVIGAVLARLLLRKTACHRCALAAAAMAVLIATPLWEFPRMLVLAAAMGLQDAAVNHFAGLSINTVFVSGTLVRLGDAVANVGDKPASSWTALHLGSVWLGYVVGGAVGAIATRIAPLPAFDFRLSAAAVVLGLLAVFAQVRRSGDSSHD